MVNIIGIALLIFAILWPLLFWFILGMPVIIIWIGFLALLSTGKFVPPTAIWNKWARVGLFVYVLLTGIYFYCVITITFPVLKWASFVHFFIGIYPFLLSPFSYLCYQIFPSEVTKLSNHAWSIKPQLVMIKATGLMNIIDISLYLVAGILIGKLAEIWSKIHNSNSDNQSLHLT